MKIACIFSDDEDLKFLATLVSKLEAILGKDQFKVIKLIKDVKTHYDAQNLIKESESIIFLCHGGSDYILGHNEIGLLEQGSYYQKLIGEHNITILKSKKVICVACESKTKLAKLAIEGGCYLFVGFGDIQFEDKYHLENGEGTSLKVEDLSQQALIEVFYKSLELVLKVKGTAQNFVDYFKLIANKKCDSLVLDAKGDGEIIRVANFLWNLKNEMELYGNNDKLFDF